MKALTLCFVVLLAVVYSQYTQKPTTSYPYVRCPAENAENATLLPNPYNCNTYFVCETGTPIPMKCPKGLHFNAKLSVCDWPSRANCKQIKPEAS